jgi:hypothetical protein
MKRTAATEHRQLKKVNAHIAKEAFNFQGHSLPTLARSSATPSGAAKRQARRKTCRYQPRDDAG